MSTNRQQGNMSKWAKCCHKTVANSSSNQTRLGHQNRVQKIHEKYQKISEKILNKVYKQIAKSKWPQTNHAQSSRAGIKRLIKRCMTDYRWLAGQRGVCTTLPREDRGRKSEREVARARAVSTNWHIKRNEATARASRTLPAVEARCGLRREGEPN